MKRYQVGFATSGQHVDVFDTGSERIARARASVLQDVGFADIYVWDSRTGKDILVPTKLGAQDA